MRRTRKIFSAKLTSRQRSQHSSMGCRAWQNNIVAIAWLRVWERVCESAAIRASTSSKYRNSVRGVERKVFCVGEGVWAMTQAEKISR